MRSIKIIGLAAISAAAALTACSSAGSPAAQSSPAAPVPTSAATVSPPLVMQTLQRMQQICQDIGVWGNGALTQSWPIFSQQLQNDQTEALASGQQIMANLGTDMQNLEADLAGYGRSALLPGLSGYSRNTQTLRIDCYNDGEALPAWGRS